MTATAPVTHVTPADQFRVNAMGGVIQANKPVVGGQGADGQPSAALFYWSHTHFTADFEFGLHRHEGFEIVTFVLDGENSHFDTTGTGWTPLRGGDVQIIRSGSGISHNERVVEGTEAFQIWFDPGYHEALRRAPDYTDHPAASFTPRPLGGLTATEYIGGEGPIRSLVEGLSVRRLSAGGAAAETVTLGPDRYSVLYVINGPATVEGRSLATDDALILHGSEQLAIEAPEGADLFVVSLPGHPGYTPVRGR